MRIRYCQVLQKVNMEGQANSWLPELTDASVFSNSETRLPHSREEFMQLIRRKLRSLNRHHQDDASSPDLLILESQRPATKTEKIIESFKSLRAKPHAAESHEECLQSWLHCLVQWISDSEESVVVSVPCSDEA